MPFSASIRSFFSEMTLLPTWMKRSPLWTSGAPEIQASGKKIISSGSRTLDRVRLRRKEKIFLLDTLGSLVSAGIPFIKSLQLLYFQSKNKSLQSIALYIKSEVEIGKNLADITRSLPRVFSGFDAAMFEMGDATGKIGQIFETLAEKEEKMLDLERKVTGALIYPMAIVVVAVTMVCILLIYVIPRIEAIYKEAHTSLPPLTTFVISISHGLRDFGIWIVLALIGIVTLIQILLRKPDIRMSLDRAVLHLPIFGPMLQQKNLVIFSDFLSILLASGVTIHRALEIVAQGMENFHYKRAVGLLIRDIRQGKYLSLAMGGDYLEQKIAGTIDTSSATSISKEQLWTFTMELSTAVKVGEQTGKLSHMLEKASKRYEKDIDTTVRSLSALLEPIVIIVIGAIVGVIVLAIMMPFFNMVKVIG